MVRLRIQNHTRMSLPSFAELEVSAELQKSIDRLGFEAPAPVQTAVLMALNAQRSAVIAAPPRSGRGTALALAAVKAATKEDSGLRVLILGGTRSRVLHLTELVGLVAAGRKGLTVGTLVAGQSAERQTALLEKPPAILVATPGTIRQCLQQNALALKDTTTLLVDACDDLVDGGMEEDLEAVIAALPEGRTIIALASVMTRDLEALTHKRMPEADRLVSEPTAPPANLTWFSIHNDDKFEALTVLADRHQLQQVLVVVNNRKTAEALADRLTTAGYAAESALSGITATARERISKKFRQGSITFLVVTTQGLSELELEPAGAALHWDWPLDDSEFTTLQQRVRPGALVFGLAAGRELVRARAISRRGSPVRLGRLPLLGEVPELRFHANVQRIREALAGRNPAACRSVVDLLMAEGFEPAVIAGAAIRLLGAPELPSLPPPPPAPVPARTEPTPEVVAPAPEAELTGGEQATVEAGVQTDESAGDWSPGVGASDQDGSGTEGGYEGGDASYAYTDNAAEDGVVYPPEANFGQDEEGGDGMGDERPGRRPRRGNNRPRGGGGRGGDGGPMASGMKRLWLNVGRMDRIQPRDIVGCILGETGLPSTTVGRVQLFERHCLVDVSATFETQVLEALNRSAVRGRKLKAKIAAY